MFGGAMLRTATALNFNFGAALKGTGHLLSKIPLLGKALTGLAKKTKVAEGVSKLFSSAPKGEELIKQTPTKSPLS